LQFLSRDDIHRLEQYGRNLVEYTLVLDIVPALAALYLGRRMPSVRLSHLQCAILVAVGCQHRTFDQVAAEFNAPTSQLLALFNKAMHKLANHCRSLLEQQVEEEEGCVAGDQTAKPLKSGEVFAGGEFVRDSLKHDQKAAAKKVNKKLDSARQELLSSLTDDLAVAPGEEDLRAALGGQVPTSGTLSVKRKRDLDNSEPAKFASGSGQGGKKRK
jgi:N-acetyltransferase 10